MNTDRTDLEETLESHEAAVKRALESLGELQQAVGDGTETLPEAHRESLIAVGKALETHEQRLETVVETLNDHKGQVGGADGASALGERLERERQRAGHVDAPGQGGDPPGE
jgi:hypothetical protein